MKKLLAFLLALCLPAMAAAETVSEQVRAPERVTAEWVSNTGKTVIRLDAQVGVPDAAEMRLIPVVGVPFDDALVPALAELIWPGLAANVETGDSRQPSYRWHGASIVERGVGGRDVEVQVSASCRDQLKGMADGACNVSLAAKVEYGHAAYDGSTVNYSKMYFDAEVQGEGIAGHPMTSAQAAQTAADFLRQLTDLPFEVFAVGQCKGGVFTDEPVPGMDYDSSYVVLLTRQVDGVPLLPSLFQDMAYWGERTDLFAPPVGYERVEVNIDREGSVVSFGWKNFWEPSGEPVPQTLLPFEDILLIASRVLPLKYLWLEPYTERLDIDVTRVELGYMALMQRDTQRFALTPVWTFYGDGEMLPSFQDVLTVNAVDGTVIDLELGY